MGAFRDLTGQKFNRLTMLEPVGNDKHGRRVWKCECDCGNIVYKPGWEVSRGHIKSCGCALTEANVKRLTKHGKTGTRLYGVWQSIRQRCNDPNNKRYERYGGRGITICPEWNNFATFEKWAMDNGYDPIAKRGVTTIERIDNNGNYEPNNCRWATNKEQANNKTTNVVIEYRGEKRNLAEWSEILGINLSTLITRRSRGYTGDKLFYVGDLRYRK